MLSWGGSACGHRCPVRAWSLGDSSGPGTGAGALASKGEEKSGSPQVWGYLILYPSGGGEARLLGEGEVCWAGKCACPKYLSPVSGTHEIKGSLQIRLRSGL